MKCQHGTLIGLTAAAYSRTRYYSLCALEEMLEKMRDDKIGQTKTQRRFNRDIQTDE